MTRNDEARRVRDQNKTLAKEAAAYERAARSARLTGDNARAAELAGCAEDRRAQIDTNNRWLRHQREGREVTETSFPRSVGSAEVADVLGLGYAAFDRLMHRAGIDCAVPAGGHGTRRVFDAGDIDRLAAAAALSAAGFGPGTVRRAAAQLPVPLPAYVVITSDRAVAASSAEQAAALAVEASGLATIVDVAAVRAAQHEQDDSLMTTNDRSAERSSHGPDL